MTTAEGTIEWPIFLASEQEVKLSRHSVSNVISSIVKSFVSLLGLLTFVIG